MNRKAQDVFLNSCSAGAQPLRDMGGGCGSTDGVEGPQSLPPGRGYLVEARSLSGRERVPPFTGSFLCCLRCPGFAS